ncbi:MAG: tRNA (adenosine(37)-N6)-threonylcarbamoyltransferase complex dimerization subunit type 1 TsaB [Clostridia bacterium]|nr:tRNA (adenosine(37)-N6)-threonylcarbamoyltransferase complex dimerization subunit type 1 TsaB [Clostridia bacterium]
MENYLAIDTSSKHLTVIACKGGKVATRYNPDCALHHSVLLMGEVQSAMDGLSLAPAECEFFCAVTGPGSFTGIRIGISAAKGFASATGKPLMPLTAFDMVAYNVNDAERFCVAIDAAHGHYYCMEYVGGKGGEPCYKSREDVEACGLPIYGYEPLDLPRYTRIAADKALKTAVERRLQSGDPFGEMTALYVRKSQAEEGRA